MKTSRLLSDIAPELLTAIVAAAGAWMLAIGAERAGEAARDRNAVAASCLYGEPLHIKINGNWLTFRCKPA